MSLEFLIKIKLIFSISVINLDLLPFQEDFRGCIPFIRQVLIDPGNRSLESKTQPSESRFPGPSEAHRPHLIARFP